ncbi:MAG: hypothetical protein ACRC7R_12275, partial [Sarcina sp.]
MKSKKIIALVLAASLVNSSTNVGILVKATGKTVENINTQIQQEKSKLENNVINVCGTVQNQVDFKIGFDDVKKEFRVYDQTSNVMSKDSYNFKFWAITICDSTGKEKKYVELKGQDYANSNKLDTLKGFKYEYGDVIELWHKQHYLFKQSIDGKILDSFDNYSKKLPENNLIRFQITKEGLKAVPTSKNLDNTSIYIKGDWWENYDEFIIHFNSKENKIKLSNLGNWYSYKSIGYQKYCIIQIFRKNQGEIFKAELNGYDTGQSEKLNRLNNFKYEYGDVIRIWHKDFQHQIIAGHVINATENYSSYRNKGLDIDMFESLGFEITEIGLKQINNEAPKLEGVKDIEIGVGEKINFQERFEINNKYPSTYKIKFTVRDLWGKETSKTMTVKVVSKLEKN